MSTSDPASTRVYAKALLEAAGDVAVTVADELESLTRLAKEEPGEWRALLAPSLSAEQRVAVIDTIFRNASPVSRNFLKVLAERGRLEELPQIAAQYRHLVKGQQNELDVRVTTAIELTPELRTRLEERLSGSTGKQVRLHATVDPAIIGGLVVQHGDTLIDTSLRGRLESLRLALQRGSLRGTPAPEQQ